MEHLQLMPLSWPSLAPGPLDGMIPQCACVDTSLDLEGIVEYCSLAAVCCDDFG